MIREKASCQRTSANTVSLPWWKEPTKDQWLAWVAAWLGWTLDAFDFTIFLLLMVPISKDFGVPLTAVAIVFTLTLWMRLVGATASGWLSDRIGRKKPLMISIAWFSVCNLFAGLSPSFLLLLLFRTLLGIGMGAEWPAGAALAMETWPQRSRGFMGSVLQGSWGLGALLSSAAYALLYDSIGWRGLLLIGVLPALLIVYIRKYVKEPEIWIENRRKQRARESRVPGAAVKHFQAGHARQYPYGVLADGQRVRRRLLGRRYVPLLPAEGPRPFHRLCRAPNHAAEPDVFPLGDPLGLVRRPLWPAADAHHHLLC